MTRFPANTVRGPGIQRRAWTRVLTTLLVVASYAYVGWGLGCRHVSAAGEPVIVALGDSLTAGFGVLPDEAYPALL